MSEAHIEVREDGKGKVIIDGHDLSDHVYALDLSVRADQLTTLTLHTQGAPKITRFAGEVQVEIAEPLRAVLIMAGWREPS